MIKLMRVYLRYFGVTLIFFKNKVQLLILFNFKRNQIKSIELFCFGFLKIWIRMTKSLI